MPRYSPMIDCMGRPHTHVYLGADGQDDELNAWAELRFDGWEVHLTGFGVPQGSCLASVLRWPSFDAAKAAWEQAIRSGQPLEYVEDRRVR